MKQSVFILFTLFSLLISCSNNDDISQNENQPFEIGDSYQGGIIFYIDDTGEHGLIASTSNQNEASWGCIATTFPTAQNNEIGSGQLNTEAIVQNCVEDGIAAKICNDLTLNGFSDWFLPSIDELELMYSLRESIGGFNENEFSIFISSSEFFSVDTGEFINCWVYDFGLVEIIPGARKLNSGKDNSFKVRAIRSF